MEMVRCRCVFIHSQLKRRKDDEGARNAHPFHTGRDDDDIAASDSRVYVPTVSNRTFGMVSFLF